MKELKRICVIGANGTMGRNISAIFASFGNAKVYMLCRDVSNAEEIVLKACQSVKADAIKNRLVLVDYSRLEEVLLDSDLIYESVSENLDVKKQILEKINKVAKNNIEKFKTKIIATGTSGLSITQLSENLEDVIRNNFLGIHFFNPPYTMSLCEIIPTKYTRKEVVSFTKEYCDSVLLRTVVIIKDSPAFLANRVGFYFINSALQLADKYRDNGGIDYIDAIFGLYTGRAMTPIKTANFVGLDVHKAIVDNLYNNSNDYENKSFKLPNFVNDLIKEGKMGKKVNEGFYKIEKNEFGKTEKVFDLTTKQYRNVYKYKFPYKDKMNVEISEGNYIEAFNILINNHSKEAELCVKMLLKYILYALNMSIETSEDILSVDDVMATGFNWCPPLAMIDALGGKDLFVKLCEDRLDKIYLNEMNYETIVSNIKPSKYDYRKFIRSEK